MGRGRLVRLLGGDAHLNQAAEEALFRLLPPQSAIFYENAPAVCIGRTQNPLIEADVEYATRHGYAVARRRSGGGAVAHGPGNLNVCVVHEKRDYTVAGGARLLADVLRERLGVDAVANVRGDVLLGGRKVSGSAHRVSGDKAYTHFTVLCDADLDKLRKVLKSPAIARIETKGTQSVRSPVANVGLPLDDVVGALGEHLAPGALVEEMNAEDVDGALDGQADFASYEWVYGRTPSFTYAVDVVGGHFVVQCARGCVVERVASSGTSAVCTVGREMHRALKGLALDLEQVAPRAHAVVARLGATPLEPAAREFVGNLLEHIPVHHWLPTAPDPVYREAT